MNHNPKKNPRVSPYAVWYYLQRPGWDAPLRVALCLGRFAALRWIALTNT
jgi:hypothetical protein